MDERIPRLEYGGQLPRSCFRPQPADALASRVDLFRPGAQQANLGMGPEKIELMLNTLGCREIVADCRMIWTRLSPRAYSSEMKEVSSAEPSSMMMSSRSVKVCESTLSTASRSHLAPSRTGITTETPGVIARSVVQDCQSPMASSEGEQGLRTVQAIRYSPFAIRSLLHTLPGR